MVERRINQNGHRKRMNNEIQKVGLEAFNELAKSHDAHVKEVERLQKELEQTKNTLYSALRGIQEGIVQLLNGNNDLIRELSGDDVAKALGHMDEDGEFITEGRQEQKKRKEKNED